MRRVPLVVSGLLAGALVGGGVGVIVGASTVPQLHACVTKTTLLMRYTATTCRSGEKLLTWNVAGVAGPSGATGATGPQGPTGPAGSGTASGFYVADGPSVNFGKPPVTVASLKVPAGGYIIDLIATLTTMTPGGIAGTCVVTDDPAGTPTTPPALVTSTFAGGNAVSVAARGYADLTGPTTLYARCTVEANALTTGARLIATTAQRLQPLP